MMTVLAATIKLGACGKTTTESTDSTIENTETDVAYEAPLYEDLTSKLVNLAGIREWRLRKP